MSDGWCQECIDISQSKKNCHQVKPSLKDEKGRYTYRCEDHTPKKEVSPIRKVFPN